MPDSNESSPNLRPERVGGNLPRHKKPPLDFQRVSNRSRPTYSALMRGLPIKQKLKVGMGTTTDTAQLSSKDDTARLAADPKSTAAPRATSAKVGVAQTSETFGGRSRDRP